MKLIDNNYRFSVCPFCESNNIHKVGMLKYAGELCLSTIRIQLAKQPELWKCNSCQSSFTQNTIPPQIAEELYSMGEGTKRWAYESFEKDKTDAVINYFKDNTLYRNKKLLDIGCNTGEFLDFAKRFGMKSFGLEICKESCELVNKKGHTGFLSSKDISEKFDVITVFDTIEHLYDVKKIFLFINSILEGGGHLIILTGNPMSFSARCSKERWWYFNYPEHVIFPSPKYFHQLDEFVVKQIISTYASKAHQSMRGSFEWMKFIKQIFSKQYNGLPAISHDHQLVILQKESQFRK